MNKVNPIEAISNEIEHIGEYSVGVLEIKPANAVMAEESKNPDPKVLYDPVIIEGGMHCLFSGTGVGKSILAVQIGEKISLTHKVLYIDAEMSGKQFQKRYTSDDGELHVFPDNFYRVTINPNEVDNLSMESKIMKDLETIAVINEITVIIVDNISYICNNAEKGDAAGEFMKALKALNQKYKWTILVVAHTPKRPAYYEITKSDLAGSSKLGNFFDYLIAIGVSAKDEKILYLKQVKTRGIEATLDSSNVWVGQISRSSDHALRIEFSDYCEERNLLKVPTEEDIQKLEDKVKKLINEGCSYREASRRTGLSKSRIGRIVKKIPNG